MDNGGRSRCSMTTLGDTQSDEPPSYQELSETEDYQYTNLATQSAESFRLFFLEPGWGDQPIRGSLFISSKSDATPYEALSYVWGNQQHMRTIWVNERKLKIGRNLHAFLCSLRRRNRYITLWTDAICINQQDDIERGHQVRQMGDIYQNAQRVLTWLGEDIYNFKILAELVAMKQAPSNEAQAKSAFMGLCKSDYWTRTWIVQELMLARALTIHVGNTCLSWQAFRDIVEYGAGRWSSSIGWEFPVEMNNVQGLIDMMDVPIAYRCATLEQLLMQCATKQCLDKRDSVYALLSLASNCREITPDYSINRLDLFFRLRELVQNHTLLMRALGLTIDEVHYRAKIFGLPVHALGGRIYVLSGAQGDLTPLMWDIRGVFQLASRTNRVWASLPWSYSFWAVAEYDQHFPGLITWLPFKSEEILQVRIEKNNEWYRARNREGETGLIHPAYVRILNVDFTGGCGLWEG